MAAPDFPASPTVNQTYTAPSGIVYTWDGAVWRSTVVGSAFWTDTGTALTPTVATRQLTVPGPTVAGVDQSPIVLGSRTTKGHIETLPALDGLWLGANRYYDGSAWQRDDTSKPGWSLQMDIAGDAFSLGHITAAGVSSNAFTADNAGHLTSKAMACQIYNNTSQGPLTANAWNTLNLPTIGADSSGGVMPVGGSALKIPTASWVIACASCNFTSTGGLIQIVGLGNYAISYFPTAGFAIVTAMQNVAANSSLTVQLQPFSTGINVVSAFFYAIILGSV